MVHRPEGIGTRTETAVITDRAVIAVRLDSALAQLRAAGYGTPHDHGRTDR